MTQVEDSETVLMTKCDQLADCIKSAKYVVVYTGAGISTVSMLLTDFYAFSLPQGRCLELQRIFIFVCATRLQPYQTTEVQMEYEKYCRTMADCRTCDLYCSLNISILNFYQLCCLKSPTFMLFCCLERVMLLGQPQHTLTWP
jgi:hypothetical protein